MGIFDKLFKKKAIESQQSIPVKQDKQEKTTVNMVTQKAEPIVKEQLIRGYVGTYKKQVDYATVKELKKRYIAFDVETTGLSPMNDKIIEVAAVLFENGEIIKGYSSLVNPEVFIPYSATAINHITNEMVKDAPKECIVYAELVDFLGDALKQQTTICAHNASFDMNFLSETLMRLGYDGKISYVDTLSLSRSLIKGLHNYKQDTVAMYFDLVKPIVDTEFKLPCININEQEKIKNSVLIHPGVSKISVAKKIIKIFDAPVWAELIKELSKRGKDVYLIGGPDDSECISKIKENLKNEKLANFTDLYGSTKNIYDLAILIKKSEVLICSDSAPMHIGVATNTKTIAIFGPTDEKKLMPKSDKFIPITNNADCRPCLWEKRQTTCNELKCLKIDLETIIKNAV